MTQEPPTYVIRDQRGRYLTSMSPGKTRRGWSNYLNRAAVFDTRDVAEWTVTTLGKQRHWAIIEEVNASV